MMLSSAKAKVHLAAMFIVGVLISLIASMPTAAQPWLEGSAANGLPALPKVLDVTTQWRYPATKPGETAVLAVIIDLKPTWHINPDAAQTRPLADFIPVPTALTIVEADPGVIFELPRFPQPHDVAVSFTKEPLPVFSDRVVVFLPAQVSQNAAPGELKIKLALRYQACDDKQCLFPTTETVETVLRVAVADETTISGYDSLFDAFDAAPPPAAIAAVSKTPGSIITFDVFGLTLTFDSAGGMGLMLMLLTAMVGGALLNFTPCVLPVVPLKIMSLSRASDNRRRCFMLGLAMSVGVVAFWLAIGIMIASVTGFTAVNHLFQYPAFTIGVGVIIAVMAIGMMGLFAPQLPQWVYAINPRQDSLHGSAGFGVMTAVLSTPCTAPFMGAAAVWAATQPPAITLMVFTAIGIGMALPYLLLSAFPALVHRVPRTGAGSALVKEVMGLLLMAAAAFFIGSGLSAYLQWQPPFRAYWWAVAAFVALSGIWLAIRTFRITPRPLPRAITAAVALLMLATALYGGYRFTAPSDIPWVYYSPDALTAATDQRKVVLLEFTAEWCLNCKALEEAVLRDKRVVSALSDSQVVPIKVDVSGRYADDATALLRQMGRITIPWLVVLDRDGNVHFGSEAYTISQVVNAVETSR